MIIWEISSHVNLIAYLVLLGIIYPTDHAGRPFTLLL